MVEGEGGVGWWKVMVEDGQKRSRDRIDFRQLHSFLPAISHMD